MITAFGFTETESAVYCALLRGGPATGYRLAQAVGKAPANVYQALAVLAQRGAASVDESEAKTYRATPPSELLGALKTAFDAAHRDAEAALATIRPHGVDDRIYHLKTPNQVYERAEGMIADAREILLFDLFPGPLARLRAALLDAHGRGVRLAGVVYSPTDVPFPVAVQSCSVVAERWPGQQVSVVADAREHLLALLSSDGLQVRHGVWSDSAYLACLQHSGLGAEIRNLAAHLGAAEPLGDIALLHAFPPGLRALIGPREDADFEKGSS